MCGSDYHRILEAAKKNETETKPIEITYHKYDFRDKFQEHTQFNLEKGITLDGNIKVNLNIHNLKDFIKEYKIDPNEFKIRELYNNSGYYSKYIKGGWSDKEGTKYEIFLNNHEDVLLFPFSGFHCEHVAGSYSIKTYDRAICDPLSISIGRQPIPPQYPTKCEILEYLKHCKGKWTFTCTSSLFDLPYLGLGLQKEDDEMVVIDDE